MSTEPTTEQMNATIAIFMGYEQYQDDSGTWFKKEGLIACMHPRLEDLSYHKSWDALRPVIDKIFEYAMAYPDQVKPVINMSIVVGIKHAHEKVYQFCKWLNQQKQNDETTA